MSSKSFVLREILTGSANSVMSVRFLIKLIAVEIRDYCALMVIRTLLVSCPISRVSSTFSIFHLEQSAISQIHLLHAQFFSNSSD